MFGMDKSLPQSTSRIKSHYTLENRVRRHLWAPPNNFSSRNRPVSVRACHVGATSPPRANVLRHMAAPAPDESAETVTKAKTPPPLSIPFATNPQILHFFPRPGRGSLRDATPTGTARPRRRRRRPQSAPPPRARCNRRYLLLLPSRSISAAPCVCACALAGWFGALACPSFRFSRDYDDLGWNSRYRPGPGGNQPARATHACPQFGAWCTRVLMRGRARANSTIHLA
jgi:hypothetical protein